MSEIRYISLDELLEVVENAPYKTTYLNHTSGRSYAFFELPDGEKVIYEREDPTPEVEDKWEWLKLNMGLLSKEVRVFQLCRCSLGDLINCDFMDLDSSYPRRRDV